MAAPKLRFKEFDQIWDNLKYKDVLTIKYGKDHKLLNEGEFPVYGTGGVMRYADQYLHDGESILIGRKGTIDQPKYVNEKFWTVDTLFYTQIKDNSIPLFLYQHALQVNWLGLNEATGVPSLNTTSINNVDIALPSKEEQTKIATFLSAVDEKISQLSQKLHLLGQYKQGMMQKLFSQQIRFKADDGSEFGEWEETTLGEIVQIKSGYSPSKYDLKSTGIIPFLKVEELNNCIKFQRQSRFYVNESSNDLVFKNSIVFPKRGAAILTNKVRILEVNSLLDSNLMALIPSHKVFYEYLYYVITFIELFKIADTSSIPQINNKHIEPYSLELPCLEEQTKIANFLSAIDHKIEVVAQQIEQAKTWKKGLLQQMFV